MSATDAPINLDIVTAVRLLKPYRRVCDGFITRKREEVNPVTETRTKAFTYIYLSGARAPIGGRRELMERRAADLGVEIVGEFIEYGPLPESAHECPKFQQMLIAVRERGDIGAILVPSVNQTHNYRRDAHIRMALFDAGVRLISGSEDYASRSVAFLLREIAEGFHEVTYGNRRKPTKGHSAGAA